MLGGLLLSYARRKRFEAKLIAKELSRVLAGDNEPEHIEPDAMLARMGVRL